LTLAQEKVVLRYMITVNSLSRRLFPLGRTSSFLKKFIEEAKRKGADIEQSMILQSSEITTFQHILHTASGVSVTDFKLGIEVVQHNSGHSPASGVSMEQYEAACEAQDDSNHDPGIIIWPL
jgi:hypothetical protein